MKLQQYSEIQAAIHEACGGGEGNVVAVLMKKFPHLEKTTLGSICTQEIQRKVKKSFHRFNTPEKSSEIFTSRLVNGAPAYSAELTLAHVLQGLGHPAPGEEVTLAFSLCGGEEEGSEA